MTQESVYAQIHRKGLATARKPRMRGAGSRWRGLDPLQSGWAQRVIATPRGFWRTAAPAQGEISGQIAAGDTREPASRKSARQLGGVADG